MSVMDTEEVHPRTLARALIVGFTCLVTLHLLHHYIIQSKGFRIKLFDLNAEQNIPTLYTCVLWFLAAFFAFRLRKHERNTAGLWSVFAVIFVFLGVDEAFSIHEMLNDPLREAFALYGMFSFPWVIPYAILLLILAPFGWKLVRSLPTRYTIGFLISGFLFVFGALVMEMAGAERKEVYGRRDFWYSVSTTIEESFELIGVSMFLYFLYEYVWRQAELLRWKAGSARKMLLYLSIPVFVMLVREFVRLTFR